ncbi:MAG TPA: PIG-L family deacetylase [Thermoanaerobaculia bacterium]|nr:PIG-L family deacetylase [Thermoanaerobaculia bacterium]
MLVFTTLLILLQMDARSRTVHHPPPQRILWIGAHPDDEALAAPLLGRACVDGGADCSLLVMTRGERGDCFLPGGCGDLGTLRAAEMARAASLFRAQLIQWSYSDALTDVDSVWSREAGGHQELVDRIRSVITATSPTVIYTFDPNHGSTCHAAHRALGALVLEAAGSKRVELLETIVDFLPDAFGFHAATPEAAAIDATLTWHYLVDDVATHASQFTSGQIESLRREPDEQRRVWLATAPAQKYNCDR